MGNRLPATAAILCLICCAACSPPPIIKTEYIRQAIPSTPPDPDFLPIAWSAVATGYCLDADATKALLKDVDMLRTQRDELKAILDGLRKQATTTK